MNPVERFGYDMTRGQILFKLDLVEGSPVFTVLDFLAKSQLQYIVDTEGLVSWLRRETYEWVTDVDDNYIPGVYFASNIDSDFVYPYSAVVWNLEITPASSEQIEVGSL